MLLPSCFVWWSVYDSMAAQSNQNLSIQNEEGHVLSTRKPIPWLPFPFFSVCRHTLSCALLLWSGHFWVGSGHVLLWPVWPVLLRAPSQSTVTSSLCRSKVSARPRAPTVSSESQAAGGTLIEEDGLIAGMELNGILSNTWFPILFTPFYTPWRGGRHYYEPSAASCGKNVC